MAVSWLKGPEPLLQVWLAPSLHFICKTARGLTAKIQSLSSCEAARNVNFWKPGPEQPAEEYNETWEFADLWNSLWTCC